MPKRSSMRRRTFLKRGAQASLAGAAMLHGFSEFSAPLQASDRSLAKDPKFLIVLTASGGASIIDSFMAIRESESANGKVINTFEDRWVQDIEGTPFRAVDYKNSNIGAIPVAYETNQSGFVKKHAQDMMVTTLTGTSVNHATAQYRAVTGNAAWNGRTLQEAVAQEYGANYLLPNVHLLTGTSYTNRGTDYKIANYAYGETIAVPKLWPISLDGKKGVSHAPNPTLVERAKVFRNTKLDASSQFSQIFRNYEPLKLWKQNRAGFQKQLEAEDLITKLMLFPDSTDFPLAQHGLGSSPLIQEVQEKFPDYQNDPLESQAALAFLLLKYRLSVAVTLGTSFNAVTAEDIGVSEQGSESLLNFESVKAPPLGFDYSHQSHRDTQAVMWDRVLGVADKLIDLLKTEEYKDGQSMWDRSLIYVATDFGRTKKRTAGEQQFSSSHDLNNAALILSPMANGGKLLGGIDRDTGLTYGFDPVTGDPKPESYTTEAMVFSGLAHTLGLNTSGSGLVDVPIMRKA